MGKKKKPKQPDYAAAAERQQEANRETTLLQGRINRPDMTTPWGNTQWTMDPETGESTGNMDLNPWDARSLARQQQVGAFTNDLAHGMRGQLRRDLASPVDYSDFTQWGDLGNYDDRRDRAEQSSYDRATSRLDPYWDDRTNEKEIELRSQGLVPGDEAYERAMSSTQRSQNDAYSLAEADAIASGRAESDLSYRQQMGEAQYGDTQREKQIVEELRRRGWTHNEMNALMAGTDINPPPAPGYSPVGATQAADFQGAAAQQGQNSLDRFNAEQGQRNSLFSGIGSVAGGLLGKK